jgi:hypothetical protein
MARHASMAEQLAAVRAYTKRPEHSEPLQTNWSTVAANDNNPEDMTDMRPERRLRIRPSEPVIDGAISGEVIRGPDVFSAHFDRMIPGPIIAIGELRFSDGTQTEKASTYAPDGRIVQFDARMPVGAMLGTQEKQERMLGGDDDTSDLGATCSRVVKWLGAKRTRSRLKRERDKSKDRNYTQAESKAMLEDAWRNTDPAKVRWTFADKAMPWRPSNSTELFLSMVKTTKGESGSVAWQDITGHIEERQAWARAIDSLKPESREMLEKVATASSLAEIGGHGHRRSAERRGRRMLMAANDDIAVTLKIFAA